MICYMDGGETKELDFEEGGRGENLQLVALLFLPGVK